MSKQNKPKSAEEWKEHDVQNEALIREIKEKESSYVDMDDITFKNSLVGMNKEFLEHFLHSMRITRDFYKKVLTEPYYVEHPEKKSTYRYEDAHRKYESINSKGKVVQSLIQNS